MSSPTRVQTAVFEYLTNPHVSIRGAALEHSLNPSTFQKIVQAWVAKNPNAAPVSPTDIIIADRRPGRPRAFTGEEEELIAKTALEYANDEWPLTVTLLQEIADHFLQRHTPAHRRECFKTGSPSRGWVENFIRRRADLAKVPIRTIEDKRADAVRPEVVGEHYGRVEAVFNRYLIRDPEQVVNLDQSGSSFDRMYGRSLRRGIAKAERAMKLTLAGMRTKGNLNHVTLMAVVGANGTAYKPAFVFPGKQPHFRRLASGRTQTVHDFLPDCYFYQRDPAGVDRSIIQAWAHGFLEETERIRRDGKYMVLFLDGFSGHIQFEVLKLLRENRIIVVALPAHTSHCLQPLDVGVFSSYKSALQAEIHKLSRHTRTLDVYGAADSITKAYMSSVTYANIISGFEKTGLWVRSVGGPSAQPLAGIFNSGERKMTVRELMESFDKSTRGLLFSADVMQNGTVRIDTSTGANLTSDEVLGALQLREKRRERAASRPTTFSPFRRRALGKRRRQNEEDVDETLAPARKVLRADLTRSRATRRAIRRFRVDAQRRAKSFNGPITEVISATPTDILASSSSRA